MPHRLPGHLASVHPLSGVVVMHTILFLKQVGTLCMLEFRRLLTGVLGRLTLAAWAVTSP